ncbi:MAG: cation-translocating P-type ATPase [Dehalococcoidia bacterium]
MSFEYLPPNLGEPDRLPPLSVLSEQLESDSSLGLTAPVAAQRLRADGPNEPAPVVSAHWTAILRHQFVSKLIWILALATVISLTLGDWLNSAAIGVTVVFTTLIGFINELRSERSISALRDLTARRAEVIRDGLVTEVPARDLVAGDLVFLNEGDVVPADARVAESRGLLVNESILTGEPVAMPKSAETLEESADDPTPATLVFAGTTVVAGSGRCLVVGTGRSTALGRIFQGVASASRPETPLEARLDALGNRLILAFLAVTVLIGVLGAVQGRELRLVVETAVSLAIGAVPEGLPAVATISLAVAVRRLAANRVLVRRLDAVETLGSTTTIVFDKTGTLTENRMVLRSVLLRDGTQVAVDVSEDGGLLTTTLDGVGGEALTDEQRAAAARILQLTALCNDAVVEYDDESLWHAHGDPMEGALALAARGLGFQAGDLAVRYPRIRTEPFSSAARMMTTVHEAEGGTLRAIKGALEPVIQLDPGAETGLVECIGDLGAAGYRVLAVAEQTGEAQPVLVGAVVLEDPLRGDTRQATAAARASGLRLVLVTGDQVTTATNVAQQTGILVDGSSVVSGHELDLDHLDRVAVVARATYAQKEEIIRQLQRQGEVVAMTGDGVNDAAALRASHVGVAVGPGATDVAVEASDVVLADGRMESLVLGIREGRQVTESLRRAIVYLLTASFGTIGLITLGMIANQPLPLGALQILWLNIAVHVFPALALATSAEALDHSGAPTRSLFLRSTWIEIGWRATASALAAFVALVLAGREFDEIAREQTVVYLTIASVLIGQAFLTGVSSTLEQVRRFRDRTLWIAVVVSLGVMLAGVVLPGIQPALDLAVPSLRMAAMAAVAAAGGLVIAQAGSVVITRVDP